VAAVTVAGVVAMMLLAGGTTVAVAGSTSVAPSLPVTTSHFYAVWSVPLVTTQVVEEFSAATGQPIRRVVDLPDITPRSEYRPPNLVQASNGWIWFTEATGPGNKDTGFGSFVPMPDSCSGAVLRFDPKTGQVTTVFRTPRSVWLDAAVPSPNGRYVAYEMAPCARSLLNTHLAVRDLVTGRTWSIGQDAQVCHNLSPPAWTTDSRRLVFTCGPSALTGHVPANDGASFCAAWRPDELATVSALHGASIKTVSLTAAPRGCGYTKAVVDAWGVLALRDCPADLGTGSLVHVDVVQLNDRLRPRRQWKLPPEEDGTSLATSPNGRLVLIDEYESPTYAGLRILQQETEWIEVLNGSHLRLIRRVRGASPDVSEAIW
jgi:hypothetical protein